MKTILIIFIIFNLFLTILSFTLICHPAAIENNVKESTVDYAKPEISDFLLETTTRPRVNYCELCDDRGKHTMCRFPNCTVSGDCTKMKQQPLKKEEKETILTYHNIVRDLVAKGQVGGQPPASNMNQLEWDDELEMIAQCWANQCQFEHDDCRNTETDNVGQNIVYYGHTSKQELLRKDLHSIIDNWFNQYRDFPKEYIPSWPYPDPTSTGHYTQMVWAKTRRIGCARVYGYEEPFYKIYLYCNYAPRGNIGNNPVYKIGNPATECEAGRTKSTIFSGLCDDKY